MTKNSHHKQKLVSFGFDNIEASEKKPRVGAIFSNVARSYDIMNDAMSAGTHRLWKNRFVRRVKPRADERILDMAGGTGDIAFRMAKSGAQLTIADINPDMLKAGQKRSIAQALDTLEWRVEDAEKLSFADRSFDAYTIAFGIRNVTEIDTALKEAYRVLKFGGRFFCLEFSQSRWPGFSDIYSVYAHHILPQIGQIIANDEASYRYLAESIDRFPSPERFENMIQNAGFSATRVERLMGGLVCIHSGWKT